jgi:uncharacterized protein YjbJ (UPF0337 family)
VKADLRIASRSYLNRPANKENNVMNPSTNDQIKGKIHEVKGKIKEIAGQVANNPDLKSEGKVEHLGGKLQTKVGQIEKIFEK